jgi:hypothetical protein
MKQLLCAALAALIVVGCASKSNVAALQRPHAPARWTIDLQNGDPFSESIAVPSVTGISQYSWFLPEADRTRFKPLLESGLARAGLLAPSSEEALYHLTVDFQQSEGVTIGGHMDASMTGTYRLLDAYTSAIVFETTVDADASAIFPGLIEQDFLSGRVIDWLLLAPLFPALFPEANSYTSPGVVQTLPVNVERSNLVGDFYGYRRSDQVVHLMMQQSIARFIGDLVVAEDLPVLAILPCGRSPQLDQMKLDLTLRGHRWITTACRASDLG